MKTRFKIRFELIQGRLKPQKRARVRFLTLSCDAFKYPRMAERAVMCALTALCYVTGFKDQDDKCAFNGSALCVRRVQ